MVERVEVSMDFLKEVVAEVQQVIRETEEQAELQPYRVLREVGAAEEVVTEITEMEMEAVAVWVFWDKGPAETAAPLRAALAVQAVAMAEESAVYTEAVETE